MVVIPITREMVKITVKAEPEIDPIKSAAKGCAPGFERSVLALQKVSRKWGWCSVSVSVRLKLPIDITGEAYLGHCSYRSKQDFIDDSGYYDQLVNDAISDLVFNLNAKVIKLQKEISEFSCINNSLDLFPVFSVKKQ